MSELVIESVGQRLVRGFGLDENLFDIWFIWLIYPVFASYSLTHLSRSFQYYQGVSYKYLNTFLIGEMLMFSLSLLFQVKKSGMCETLSQEERKRQEVTFHMSAFVFSTCHYLSICFCPDHKFHQSVVIHLRKPVTQPITNQILPHNNK